MDVPPRKRLTRDDWTTAALEVLTTRGPDAVAIEPIAASLGATKGSGYWHFSGARELLGSALEAWRVRATLDVIAEVESHGGTAVERMGGLLNTVTAAAESSPAEMLLMGSADETVRAVVGEVMQLRLDYLAHLIVESGQPRVEARSRAVLAYSAYLGYAMLAVAAPDILPRRPTDRRRTQAAMLELATHSGGSAGTSRSGRS